MIKQIPQIICNPISITKPNPLPFEARERWGFSTNHPGTERGCSDSSPTKLEEMWADTLERATGSSMSRGRREAKRLDEVNETLVSSAVARSQGGSYFN